MTSGFRFAPGGRQRLFLLDELLDTAYGAPEAVLGNQPNALDEAVYIILSFQTDLPRFFLTNSSILRTERQRRYSETSRTPLTRQSISSSASRPISRDSDSDTHGKACALLFLNGQTRTEHRSMRSPMCFALVVFTARRPRQSSVFLERYVMNSASCRWPHFVSLAMLTRNAFSRVFRDCRGRVPGACFCTASSAMCSRWMETPSGFSGGPG